MTNNRFFIENIKISLGSILGNKLRAILTITIIAIGIMALVGIITATEAIKQSITTSFSQAGAGSFTIDALWNYGSSDSKRRKRNSRISYEQAMKYKKHISDRAKVSVSINVASNNSIKYGSKKTNPNIEMIGIDEHFFEANGFEFESGRNISTSEIETQRPVAIIGTGVVEALFSEREHPIGKEISVSGKAFMVIGIKKKRGTSMGFNEDGTIYIPLTTASSAFSIPSPNYHITTIPNNADVNATTSHATGIMRVVRLLRPTDAIDFEITTSDFSSNQMLKDINMVVLAAYLIGFITLLGATVALMNIMLV
ncbi:MAG: ABC transporter permease, partial [Rikenellaceae bacterium]